MEIKKIKENIFEIQKTPGMNVPVRVYVSEKMLDSLNKDKCLSQGMNATHLPGIQKYFVMLPDTHQGYGFPIGGVAAFDMENGCISPGAVGYDQNCGVRLLTTNLDKGEVYSNIKDLLNEIFANVPCGVGSESKLKLSDEEMDNVLNKGIKWCIENSYATEYDFEHCEENGYMKTADASKVSPKAKARGRKQLGTLGAGNHFLEVQYVEKIFDKDTAKAFGINHEGQVTLMIHCGSRGLGHQVCSDYLRRIEKEFPELVSKLPEKELAYAPSTSVTAKDYLSAMSSAANFAWANRQIIQHNCIKAFKKIFPDSELKLVYDVAHNIIKIEEHEVNGETKKLYVHRKGATRAFPAGRNELPEAYRSIGQPVILPGSMGTSSYVLVGSQASLDLTFGSTAHGAGRVMSRHEALRKFKGENVKEELAKHNIIIKSASIKGISEEAPDVYKDIDEVVKVSHDLGIGKLVAKVKPIGVIKG